jgi:hypothetical protein
MSGRRLFKVSVCIPPDRADELMDAVDAAIAPVHPGYDRTFSVIESTGTWRSLEGSDPYDGAVGEVTTARELIVGFAVDETDLPAAVAAVVAVHPYEEPCIDILPLTDWKTLVTRPCK